MSFYELMPQIVNMSLTASVAIVLVMLLRLLLKNAPKAVSYALWAVVLFRLLCPVSIESDFSLYGIFDAPAEESGAVTSVIEYVPAGIVHMENPSVSLPLPGVSDAVNEVLPQGREQMAADPLEGPVYIATCVWVAGVLAMAAYGAFSYIRLRRKLATAVPLRDNVFAAEGIGSPFVMGLLSPRIYLPYGLEEREREYVILHEQHHIRRLDHVTRALAFAALCVHWFNPLVWAAFVLSGKDMEMSCDEAVMRKMGPKVRADYSASLLGFASGRRIIAATPLAFGEGDTRDRIENLARWKKPAAWIVAAAALVCVVAALALATNPASKPDEKLAVFVDCEIASYHQSPYSGENFCCLDWDLIGTERDGDQTTLYMWVLYKEYSYDGVLHLEAGAHQLTAITVEQSEGSYRLVEYWTPEDGSYYSDSIKAKVPMRLWGKAMDSQRYIDDQSAELERMAKEHFSMGAESNAEGDETGEASSSSSANVDYSEAEGLVIGTPFYTVVIPEDYVEGIAWDYSAEESNFHSSPSAGYPSWEEDVSWYGHNLSVTIEGRLWFGVTVVREYEDGKFTAFQTGYICRREVGLTEACGRTWKVYVYTGADPSDSDARSKAEAMLDECAEWIATGFDPNRVTDETIMNDFLRSYCGQEWAAQQ